MRLSVADFWYDRNGIHLGLLAWGGGAMFRLRYVLGFTIGFRDYDRCWGYNLELLGHLFARTWLVPHLEVTAAAGWPAAPASYKFWMGPHQRLRDRVLRAARQLGRLGRELTPECQKCDGQGLHDYWTPLPPDSEVELDYRDGSLRRYVTMPIRDGTGSGTPVRCQLCTGTGRWHWLTWPWYRSLVVKSPARS